MRRYNALAARRVPKVTAAQTPTERRAGRYTVANDMMSCYQHWRVRVWLVVSALHGNLDTRWLEPPEHERVL